MSYPRGLLRDKRRGPDLPRRFPAPADCTGENGGRTQETRRSLLGRRAAHQSRCVSRRPAGQSCALTHLAVPAAAVSALAASGNGAQKVFLEHPSVLVLTHLQLLNRTGVAKVRENG